MISRRALITLSVFLSTASLAAARHQRPVKFARQEQPQKKAESTEKKDADKIDISFSGAYHNTSTDIGDAELPAELDAFGSVGVLLLAFGRIGIDVVSIDGE